MWEAEKREIIETALKLVQYGLVSGTAGNISRRLRDDAGKEYLVITPSSLYYDLIKTGDIAILDITGKQIAGNAMPSTELFLHLEIYHKRDDVNAVIHTHSIYATALAVAGLNIPPILDDQVYYLGGEIKVSKHELPGTVKMATEVAEAMGNTNAILMANHGALAVGKNIREAFDNCRLLERTAEIYVHALQACSGADKTGKIKTISPALFDKGRSLKSKSKRNRRTK
jgi:L-fuculose-phosphate aldolase